jgi:hypothetical protein
MERNRFSGAGIELREVSARCTLAAQLCPDKPCLPENGRPTPT